MEWFAQATQWVTENWLQCVGVLYIADKIAKATPTKYDDFVVEVVGDAIKVVFGKKAVPETPAEEK